MVSQSILTKLGLLSLTVAGDAPISSDSEGQESYIAKFKPTKNSDISGSISFEPAKNGSVLVSVDISGLPSTGGPFPYHVHELPVPSDGNCTGTKLHLNPYGGSVNATTPQGKEVGDLAGRHGDLSGSSYKVEYVDNYISLNPKSKSFIGDLSIVIHSKDNSRLNCANTTEFSVESTSINNKTNGSGSSTASVTESVNGGMGQFETGTGLVIGAVAGIVACLI
ncbi:SOD4 [Candida pseudojiufengensis]|uniref:SOD4 n=1 Tax=Candida pseudojiufengensis TaxID=497109 RepID=UPI0022256F24|nr:SOD4 [Candida pseudojiufengensis]KAI5964615.1 SOD4 [Candida pseudojiufengensis]